MAEFIAHIHQSVTVMERIDRACIYLGWKYLVWSASPLPYVQLCCQRKSMIIFPSLYCTSICFSFYSGVVFDLKIKTLAQQTKLHCVFSLLHEETTFYAVL